MFRPPPGPSGAPRTRRDRRPGRAVANLALALLLLPLSACITGQRPRFGDVPPVVTTGDPTVDRVVGALESSDRGTYSAVYMATLAFGNKETRITATSAAPDKLSVTIGSVRYITIGSNRQTCHLDTGSCTNGINAAAVSDTGMVPDFVGGAFARRMRVDLAGGAGEVTTETTRDIAGQPATCVRIPVTGVPKLYCVLASGLIASYRGADLSLQLVEYSAEPDEDQFRNTARA